jgi:predicted hydrocarbon binding protein
MYLKLFGFNSGKANAFIEGICEGLAEMLLGCSVRAEENQCIVNHNENCYIIAKSSKQEQKNPILQGYVPDLLSKRITLPKLPDTSAEIIQRIDSHDMFEWKDGMFTIFKCGAFTFPSASNAFLIRALEDKFGNEIHSILYHLARVQSKNAVELQVKVYGFKKNKELMLSILQHMELTGFGVGKPIRIDIANKKAIIESRYNSFPFHHKAIFGKSNEAVDHYLSGLIGGMCEGFFEVPVDINETKCVAKANPYCKFEVCEGKSKYKINKETLAIIKKKITPENFIL